MKTIVSKVEIANDPKLAAVKAFRLTNKRAGEAKAAGNLELYELKVSELREIAKNAKTLGVDIWVNSNGKTGHTYEKDYRVTEDSDNDFAAYQAEVMARLNSAVARGLAELPESPESPESEGVDDTIVDD